MMANIIKVGWDQMKTVGGVGISSSICSCVNKNFKVPNFFLFLKGIAYISPWLTYLYWVWLKLNENCGRSLLKILTSEILQSPPNHSNLNSKNQTGKVPYICTSSCPKFSSVSLYDQPFSRYCTFYIFFHWLPLKISKWYNIFIFGRCITYIPLWLFIMKFNTNWIKTVEGVAFCNFCSHRVPC